MTPTPLYSFPECIELMTDCRIEELVALSALLIEEWKGYTMDEQVLLLAALVKRRKALMHGADRQWRFFRSRDL